MLQSSSQADPAPFFFFIHTANNFFIEFTTEKTNKKKSLTQAEFPATSSSLASYFTHDL